MQLLFGPLAASFVQFTRIPLPFIPLTSTHFSLAVNYFPLVGMILGIIAGAIAYLLSDSLTPFGLAVIITLALLCLTGALHEDGFADCVEGILGGQDKESRLAIMKDPRLGTFGVVALLSLILLKIALLQEIPVSLWPVLWIHTQSASRLTPLLLIAISHPVPTSYDKKMSHHLNPDKKTAGTVSGLVIAINLLLLPATVVAGGLIVLLGFAFLCKHLFETRLSGYNGDCLGASQQGSECLLLLWFILSI